MSSTQEDKSSDKQRQRNRKAGRREQKGGQKPKPELDPRADDRIDAMIASTDLSANSAAVPTEQPLIGEVEPAHVPVIDAAPAIDAVPAASAQPTEPVASSGEALRSTCKPSRMPTGTTPGNLSRRTGPLSKG